MKGRQPHIFCSEKDVSEFAILPGDPGRVDRISAFLTDKVEVARNREFYTVKGFYKGVEVTVTSTGIGGPSTCIALEELSKIGVRFFIRVGSCGASKKGIDIGDLVIPYAAVREDGTTKMYVPEIYPAVAHPEVFNALVEAAKKLKFRFFTGIGRSHDSFYIPDEEEILNYWSQKNVVCNDMETTTLFVLGSLKNLFTGSILNNVVKFGEEVSKGIAQFAELERKTFEGEKKTIKAALEALVLLKRKKEGE